MSNRRSPVPIPHGAARTYESTEAILVHACGHARNRLLHACEAISMIGGLALQWKKAHRPVFSIEKAAVQDGSARSGEQAAHVLPGQILIDGHPPWALAGGERMKVAWLARFEVTSPVPVPFNTADSAAEKAGLKEAFREACEDAWSRIVEGKRDLTDTYKVFLESADRAFQNAEHAKQGKRASASSSGNSRTSNERFVEILMLRMYRVHGVTAEAASRIFPLKRASA